jgi:hypothetical protein
MVEPSSAAWNVFTNVLHPAKMLGVIHEKLVLGQRKYFVHEVVNGQSSIAR